jgi:hypothetical protein
LALQYLKLKKKKKKKVNFFARKILLLEQTDPTGNQFPKFYSINKPNTICPQTHPKKESISSSKFSRKVESYFPWKQTEIGSKLIPWGNLSIQINSSILNIPKFKKKKIQNTKFPRIHTHKVQKQTQPNQMNPPILNLLPKRNAISSSKLS